jgi:hypothetical protein
MIYSAVVVDGLIGDDFAALADDRREPRNAALAHRGVGVALKGQFYDFHGP